MTDFPVHEAERKLAALEKWLAPIFAKTPHLPESARRTLADIAPWVSLIVGILGVVTILSGGAIASFFSFFSFFGYGFMQFAMLLTLVAGLAAAVLEILAFKPLSQKMKKGWNYLFYGTIITTAVAIINLLVGYPMAGQIIGSVIGLWLLFEVRGLYR